MTKNAICCLAFLMVTTTFTAYTMGAQKSLGKHADGSVCQSCGGGSLSAPNSIQASTTNAVQDTSVIETYPWIPINKIRILPTTFPLPVATGKSLTVQATRGEFEPTSFIIRTNRALSKIRINASDLIGAGQQKIPASAIDIRLVKCWYQSGDGKITQNKTVLVPELLLRDDDLVRVNTTKQINFLKVSLDGSEQYIDISSPDAAFPDNAVIKDADTLQPFNLEAQTNKQVWVTVHVPRNTTSGDYAGSIQITAPGENTVKLTLNVTVLPFDLPQPAMEYSIYYRGKLSATTPKVVSSEWKTANQYLAEMVNMRDHGISSPILFVNSELFTLDNLMRQTLGLRKQAGISGDSLYVLGNGGTGNSDPTVLLAPLNLIALNLAALKINVNGWQTLATEFGYKNVYFYGIDEATGDKLKSERTAWETVQSTGAKVFASCYNDNSVDIVGDLLDLAVLAGAFDSATVDKWHIQGKKVFNYANPFSGLENPLIYRQNYGLALWLAGYDGAMDYAYQHAFGNIWNDFDRTRSTAPIYRDFVFAYPTTNGVIDTIQWEGFRQGVDDVRYLTALLNRQDKATVKQWLGGQLKSNSDLGSIRKAIINKIING